MKKNEEREKRYKDYPVTLSRGVYRVKPKPNEMKDWANDINSGEVIRLTIEELGFVLCSERHSFIHCTFNNNWASADNFSSSQLVVLDIDDGLSPQSALDRLKEKGLKMPSLIYRTLSDKTDESLSRKIKLEKTKKYRMIFCLDTLIEEYEFYDQLVKKYFYSLFPEADSLKSFQAWIGGQEVIYESYESSVNISLLMGSIEIDSLPIYKTPAHRKNKFKKSLPKMSPTTYFNAFFSFSSNSIINKIEDAKNVNIRNFDYNLARQYCNLLDSFLKMDTKIKTPQLMGLYSSFNRIRGGRKKIVACVQGNKFIDDSKISIHDWFKAVHEKGEVIPEYHISTYAEGDKACKIVSKLTDFCFKRGEKAVKVDNIPEIPLKEAHKMLKDFIGTAFESDPKLCKTFIRRATTGIGKTEIVLKKITKGCILSVPTHKLADELSERLDKLGIQHLKIRKLPELPSHLKEEYLNYFKVGAYQAASMYIKRLAKNPDLYKLSPVESSKLQIQIEEYLKVIRESEKTDIPILTTHKRLIHSSYPNHHTVIIDEDIRDSMLEIDSFSTKDLRIAISLLSRSSTISKNDLSSLENLLSELEKNLPIKGSYCTRSEIKEPVNMSDVVNQIELLKGTLSGNLIQFFDSDFFTIRCENEDDPNGDKIIHFVKLHTFPMDKKKILLSASFDIELYKNILGPDVVTQTILNVEHVGDRIQYSNISFSRVSINSKHNESVVKLIINFSQGKRVITFLRNNPSFGNSDNICLENCSGIDEFKGQDLVVIGTNHINDHVYQLFALALGIDFSPEDLLYRGQHVSHNGFNFFLIHSII